MPANPPSSTTLLRVGLATIRRRPRIVAISLAGAAVAAATTLLLAALVVPPVLRNPSGASFAATILSLLLGYAAYHVTLAFTVASVARQALQETGILVAPLSRRWAALVRWGLINGAATFLFLDAAGGRGRAATFLGIVAEFAWATGTMYVPVILVLDSKPVLESVRESFLLVGDHLGHSVIAQTGGRILACLVAAATLTALAVGVSLAGTPGLLLGLAFGICLQCLALALRSTYAAVLYHANIPT